MEAWLSHSMSSRRRNNIPSPPQTKSTPLMRIAVATPNRSAVAPTASADRGCMPKLTIMNRLTIRARISPGVSTWIMPNAREITNGAPRLNANRHTIARGSQCDEDKKINHPPIQHTIKVRIRPIRFLLCTSGRRKIVLVNAPAPEAASNDPRVAASPRNISAAIAGAMLITDIPKSVTRIVSISRSWIRGWPCRKPIASRRSVNTETSLTR